MVGRRPDAYVVRPARRTDARAWLALVKELAAFEKLSPPTPAARKRLVRDAFGPKPRIEVFVATSGGAVVAYAIAAWTYSSFLAKPTLWLEDLYVTPKHRGQGLSRQVLAALSRRALEEKAGRMEGVVLDWNGRARRFYEKTGARLKKDWILLRYDEPSLRRIARMPLGPARAGQS